MPQTHAPAIPQLVQRLLPSAVAGNMFTAELTPGGTRLRSGWSAADRRSVAPRLSAGVLDARILCGGKPCCVFTGARQVTQITSTSTMSRTPTRASCTCEHGT